MDSLQSNEQEEVCQLLTLMLFQQLEIIPEELDNAENQDIAEIGVGKMACG